ncbi:hypothetical protein BN7_6217 [Wickerhamomyces ciferrii]|uniref:Uncharacterized protein n=1 Tax=Wickerhamomyces ciferrii (strain ATCC 14091 / BCRC 22168 / CBS 111 / JCM 3599 / NBRC 0793 / NRRL Y-1031 F-60-10) TaxID=1206466 RepID=K0KX50_WICCF|nr:uncharacterized protein BN7_6217 [Wickerhamomyces ciferrii]CCH46622.1 hypothetical protein BN7_6217 [Wickerhamomyces ciferrii]
MNPPDYTTPVDELPTYKPTLLYYDIVLLKRELNSPFDISKNRKWDIAIVEINSTQLNLYKIKNLNNINQYLWKLLDYNNDCMDSIDEKRSLQQKIIKTDSNFTNKSLMECLLLGNSKSIPLDIIEPYIGTRLNSYTLQSCKIGSATDYTKKNYTLRLRIEIHQILLSFINITKFNKFFNNILVAIDLSKPLELRSEPKEKTVPNEMSRFRIENFQNYYQKNCINSNSISNYRRNTINYTSIINREELIIESQKNKQRSNSLNDLTHSSISSNSIDSLVLLSDSESLDSSGSSGSSDPKISFNNIKNEFIDENLIYSLTCMNSLEAKNDWKGIIIISGNHKSQKLSKFQNNEKDSEYKNKLFINNNSLEKFHKIISNDSINSCKEFVLMDVGLVEG